MYYWFHRTFLEKWENLRDFHIVSCENFKINMLPSPQSAE